MVKLKEKLWNWGHLEGSHNACVKTECNMTPEQFAEEYDIRNSFIVSYGGNIQPPYENLAKRLSPLREIKWSVLGDASTPLPDAELGNTEDVVEVSKLVYNISGAVVDDFFSPVRVKRFTPEILKKMQNRLNENNLDFWCVLYSNELGLELDQYMECFDGITFWIWACNDTVNMKEYFEKVKKLAKGKPIMLGMYLWDYSNNTPMNKELFENQLSYYFELVKAKEIEGIVFCSSTIGDMDLESNKILKEYVKKYGDIEI